jgi:AraC-like DNA-binding protein
MYFMIPGQVHSWHFESPVDGYIVHFNETLFSSFLQNSHFLERFPFFQGNASNGVYKIPSSNQAVITEIFETILREAEAKNIDLLRIKLLELFLLIERDFDHRQARKIPRQKQTLLRNFLTQIDKHYRTINLPKEYAELLYVTPNHLNALCRDLLGKTAGDLIRERIVLEAKRLLTNADLSVTEIAYDLNFQDNSISFASSKKKLELRRMNSENNLSINDFTMQQASIMNVSQHQPEKISNPGILQLFACKCPRCRKG